MSGEEWSRRQPKRGRGNGAEEGKTPPQGEGQPPAARPSGEEEGRFRGGAYSDYPAMFPPPPGEGPPYMHPMHPYPPGPGGPPPQWGAFPPPPMGYGMYPPYQPGYPPQPYPPAQGMPPPYYGEHPPGAPRYPPPEAGTSPSGPPPQHYPDERAAARGGESARAGAYGGADSLGDSNELPDYDDESDSKLGPDTSSASRARLYIKSKVPTRQEILDRRARKNAQSRARASKLRERIDMIQAKPESERTEEERDLFNNYQYRRQRKNDRSRERAIEKKSEIERILSKPENKRTKIENDFLDIALNAKQRKNQGDRLRRQRIKQMKRAQARAEASEYSGGHRVAAVGYSEIPMSPLPTPGGQHHPSMASPSMASPGMGITFPSPPTRQPPQGSARPGPSGAGVPLPFVPPNQSYGTGDSPAARSQLHMPQQSSNVEQRRHADGSLSISIGGQGTTSEGEGGAAAAGSGGDTAEGAESGTGSNAGGNVNLSDVSQLLEYGENNEEQEGDSIDQRKEDI